MVSNRFARICTLLYGSMLAMCGYSLARDVRTNDSFLFPFATLSIVWCYDILHMQCRCVGAIFVVAPLLLVWPNGNDSARHIPPYFDPKIIHQLTEIMRSFISIRRFCVWLQNIPPRWFISFVLTARLTEGVTNGTLMSWWHWRSAESGAKFKTTRRRIRLSIARRRDFWNSIASRCSK